MGYRIILEGKVDEEIIREVQSKHSRDVEGINELYDLLAKNGSCDSEEVSKIYYVAYTLSLRDITMIIIKLD